MATLGEGHFCGGIGGYVGRWEKGSQVERWLAKLGNGTSL